MILNIFSIFDSKAEAYLQPFFMTTKGQAVRAFTDAVNDPKSQFYSHLADYTLFHLGNFDDSTATFCPLSCPLSLGNALEYKSSVFVNPSVGVDDVDTDGLIQG